MNEIDERAKDEVIGLIKRQMKVEGELVALYERTADYIISSPVKHLLHTIQLDSMKHIDICQTITEALQGDAMARDEKEELVIGLERHLRLEKESIDRLNRIAKNAWIRATPGLRELVKKFLNDEKEHHTTLKKLAGKRFYREDPLDLFTAYRAQTRKRLWRELRGKE